MEPTPTPAPDAERASLLRALAAQAAAWWRQRLASPGYLDKFDNGDDSREGEFGRVLASFAALSTPGPKASQLDEFERLLTEGLLQRLLADPSPRRPTIEGAARDLVLSVDYGPEGLLGEVARQARVGGFPWKTTMWVNWDLRPAHCYLEVRAGYQRPTQRLPAPTADAA